MNKNKLFYLFFLSLSTLSSQIQTSFYLGAGLGTNLGGEYGLGTEFHYKRLSLNLAVGSSMLNEDIRNVTGEQSHFDYDLGLKFRLIHNFYFGLNYGLIAATISTKSGQKKRHFEKIRAFSYTINYRQRFFEQFSWLFYFGITSDSNENYWRVFGSKESKKHFAPRLGFLLGYYL